MTVEQFTEFMKVLGQINQNLSCLVVAVVAVAGAIFLNSK